MMSQDKLEEIGFVDSIEERKSCATGISDWYSIISD
jgi:hypothetical protein